MQLHAAAVRDDTRQIGRGLHQPRHRRRHALQTVGTGRDGTDQLVLHLPGDHLGGTLARLRFDRNPLLDAGELGPHEFFESTHLLPERLELLAAHQHRGRRLARNGVAQTAAVDRTEQQVVRGRPAAQQAEEQFVGIGALADDLDARMAALQPLDRDGRRRIVACGSRFGHGAEADVGIQTARAADIEFALGLRVEVEQDVAFEQPLFQPERTGHAGLLGGGKERFQRTVLQRIVLQHGQNRRRTDTVVGPQRRTVGRHPVAVDVGADRVFQEVELLVVVLLRHHVEMRLQDHPRTVLHALRGGFAHVDVVRRILAALQPQRAGHIQHVAADLLLMERRTRNLRHRREVLPHECGFQSG